MKVLIAFFLAVVVLFFSYFTASVPIGHDAMVKYQKIIQAAKGGEVLVVNEPHSHVKISASYSEERQELVISRQGYRAGTRWIDEGADGDFDRQSFRRYVSSKPSERVTKDDIPQIEAAITLLASTL